MSLPTLKTKIIVPLTRPKTVPRTALLAQLQAGRYRKLSLVTAPAGFGKSTLVSQWVHQADLQTAWVSLDANDNDPVRFWIYVLNALETVVAQVGEVVRQPFQMGQFASIEHLLVALVNHLSTSSVPVTLVLDDVHLIKSPAILQDLAFLIDHLPTSVHVVLISRSLPALPLARWRARDQVTELTLNELRFDLAEVTAFLRQVMGMQLEASTIDVLKTHTEGWAAGLQMAALSLQGGVDPERFLADFSGKDRLVADYLLEEVLQQQAPEVQEFLLATAVLDHLQGDLCDAVTLGTDGAAQLAALERANLFVIALDSNGEWYRYHHLFREMLLSRTMEGEALQNAYCRASAWYQTKGWVPEAIEYALVGEDFARAASMIEANWQSYRSMRQEATLVRWMRALPATIIEENPNLALAAAWAFLGEGELKEVAPYLKVAEVWAQKILDETPEAARLLMASIANARAYTAQAQNDMLATIVSVEHALTYLKEEDYYERGTAFGLLGLAHWANGDLEYAYQNFAKGLDNLSIGGGIQMAIGGGYVLAVIRMAQGRLNEAQAVFEERLRWAKQAEGAMPQGTAELYLGLAEMAWLRGENRCAEEQLAYGQQLREHASQPGYAYIWSVVEGLLLHSEGDFAAAQNCLQDAERFTNTSPIPEYRPIDALRAKFWLREEQFGQVKAWVASEKRHFSDQFPYLQDAAYLVYLQWLVLEQDWELATKQIGALLKAAKAGERMATVLEGLILQACLFGLQGQTELAQTTLEQSLSIAIPEENLRPYLFLSPRLQAIVKTLLAQAHQQGKIPASLWTRLQITDTPNMDNAALTDPLSERELEVLNLLASEMNGPQLAEHLMISVNTLRTHTKKIYQKLGVSNRSAAVRRAKELAIDEKFD